MSRISRGINSVKLPDISCDELCNNRSLVVDTALLLVKFWFRIIESFVLNFLPKSESKVIGEVVLITGTGHGIGKETAFQYAKLGAKVICWDINENTNEETIKEIKAFGGKAFGYKCNVTSRTEVFQLAERVKKEHGFVSIIINNAGIMPTRPLLEQNENEIKQTLDINVLAHFWVIQAFLPDMIKNHRGNIVALSSCAGLFGLTNLVPYCGTKFAVRGYMAALSEELRHKYPDIDIKLTTIYPYMIDTGLCKYPRFRFASLWKVISTKTAALSIIKAQRTGLEEASIPRYYTSIEKISRLIPKKAMQLLNDFVDVGIDSDKLD